MPTTTTTVAKRRGRKPKRTPGNERTIGRRVRELRDAAGVSQEAIGAQGFVSTPGWVKIENGQRLPSEKLIAALVDWLVKERTVRAGHRAALVEELTALKYSAHRSPFLAKMARDYLVTLPPAVG